jgi:membrane-associated phospholipid phosphatase
MKWLIKSISFIFHPVVMPLIAVVFYFHKTPRFIPEQWVDAKIISLSILSVLLPILIFYLLKTLGKAKSIYLKTTEERVFPLLINIFIIGLILYRVFPSYQIIELYYFFIGVLISNITALALTFAKFKVSLHMTAVGGVFMFFIGFAIHFSKNINGSLALMAVITGAIATSRLYLKAHTVKELLIGLLIGTIPQIIVENYWL